MIKQFFRNASVLSITEIILKTKGLILIPLLTHYFGAMNYGLWSQVTVLVSTLIPLITLGTDNAVILFLPGMETEKQKKVYSSWVLFISLITLLFSALIWVFNPFFSRVFFGDGVDYSAYIFVSIISLMITMMMNVFRNWFRIHNQVKTYAIISISQAVINILAVVFVLVYRFDVIRFIQVTLAGEGILVLWLFLRISMKFGWSTPDYSLLGSMIRFGLPLVPAGYAMWGLNSLDRIFLVQYSTMAEIGIYSTIYSLGYMVIQHFVNPIWTLFPNTAASLYNKGNNEGLQRLFNFSTGAMLIICLPSFAGLYLLGKPILQLLTPPEFIHAASIISIVAIGYFFLMLSAYYETALGLVRKQYFSTVSIIVAVVTNIILNFVLIPRFSILGAAIATSLSFSIQFCCSYILEKRYAGVLKTNWIFPIKVLAAVLGMTFILYFSGLPELQQPVIAIITSGIAGAVIYAGFLFLMGILDKSMIQKGLRIFQKDKVIDEAV
jgi:O-antigen/teichoic acid export membrane protein